MRLLQGIVLLASLSLPPNCDSNFNTLSSDDAVTLSPVTAILTVGNGASADGGLGPTASFTVVGTDSKLKPREGAHVVVTTGGCGSRIAGTVFQSVGIQLIAKDNCSQTSGNLLQCVLNADGTARFEVAQFDITSVYRAPFNFISVCSGAGDCNSATPCAQSEITITNGLPDDTSISVDVSSTPNRFGGAFVCGPGTLAQCGAHGYPVSLSLHSDAGVPFLTGNNTGVITVADNGPPGAVWLSTDSTCVPPTGNRVPTGAAVFFDSSLGRSQSILMCARDDVAVNAQLVGEMPTAHLQTSKPIQETKLVAHLGFEPSDVDGGVAVSFTAFDCAGNALPTPQLSLAGAGSSGATETTQSEAASLSRSYFFPSADAGTITVSPTTQPSDTCELGGLQ